MIFSLSLDDFSPHPHAGLNFESVYWCLELIKIFPDIKITLFVPTRYARLGEKSYNLSEHRDWCKRVNQLPENFQIGLHGLYHRSCLVDYSFHNTPSNNDEFRYLNALQSEIIIDEMLKEVQSSGLKYSKIFRPPRWSISNSAARILTAYGFVIAGHKDYYEQCKNIDRLKWISVNWHLVGAKPNGDIMASAHTSDWTYNYFNEKMFSLVKDLLYEKDYTFKFLDEVFG